MNTKIILESKSYSLTPSIENQISRFTDKLIQIVEDIGPVKIKAFLLKQPHKEYHIFTFHDVVPQNESLEVIMPVYLKTVKGKETLHGMYDSDFATMYIYLDTITETPPEYLRSIVVHEFVHAVQQYQKTSKQYKKAIEKNKLSTPVYFNAPVEYEAYTTQFMSLLEKYYFSLNNEPYARRTYGITTLVNERQLFLSQVYFALVRHYSESLIPSVFTTFKAPFKHWRTDKKLWHKFKRKLFEKLQELHKQIKSPRIGKPSVSFSPSSVIYNIVDLPYDYK